MLNVYNNYVIQLGIPVTDTIIGRSCSGSLVAKADVKDCPT